MKAVISGATGAIGMALLGELTKQGCEVLVLCRKQSARTAQIPSSPLIRCVECSLEQMNSYVPSEDEKYDVFSTLLGEEPSATAEMICICKIKISPIRWTRWHLPPVLAVIPSWEQALRRNTVGWKES